MNFFKKAILFFCVAAFLAPIICLNILQIKTWMVQHEMIENLEHSQLQTIFLKTESIQWKEEGKELIIQNCLFDVKNFEKLGEDTYKVVGLFDKEEKNIYDNIDLFIKKENSSSKLNFYAQFFSITSLAPELEITLTIPSKLNIELYHFCVSSFPHVHLNIINPPPEFVI